MLRNFNNQSNNNFRGLNAREDAYSFWSQKLIEAHDDKQDLKLNISLEANAE